MATFAVISGDQISNIIVADNKDEAEQALGVTLIEYTPENPAGIGWTYQDGQFIPPPVIETEEP